jgi:hypothetical protein
VQGDLGLHVDGGEAVPHHVVHLLGDPQALLVGVLAGEVVTGPGGRLAAEPHGHAHRERHHHPSSARHEAHDVTLHHDVQQQDRERDAGGGRGGLERQVAGGRVDRDHERDEDRAVRVAQRQVGRGRRGGRGERDQRPAPADHQRQAHDHDQHVRERGDRPFLTLPRRPGAEDADHEQRQGKQPVERPPPARLVHGHILPSGGQRMSRRRSRRPPMPTKTIR